MEELTKHVPGTLGALSAVLLMRENWKRGLLMVAPAIAMAFYGAPWLSAKTDMPEGLAGYLLGLFGMAAAAKVLDTWEKFDLGGLLSRWLAKILGLPNGGSQ